MSGINNPSAPIDANYVVMALNSVLTTERVLAPRDLLRLVDAGANGNANIDFDPNDPTVCWMCDDFLDGINTSGSIGQLGWRLGTIGAVPTASSQAGAEPNRGIKRLTTTATAGQGGNMLLAPSNVAPLGNLSNQVWESHWIFRLNSTASVRFRIGFSSGSDVVEPTDGIWVRYDTNVAYNDANFRFICRAASINTDVNSTIVADTNFHRVRIRSTTAGITLFQLYDSTGTAQGSEQSISTNVPTVSMSPMFTLVTDGAAAKSADVDLFTFRLRGIAR